MKLLLLTNKQEISHSWTKSVFMLFVIGLGIITACNKKEEAEPVISESYSIDKVSGDNQSGLIGQKLPYPVIVRVLNKNGEPAANRTVKFEITAGQGSVNPQQVSTDANGFAQTDWTIGNQQAVNYLQVFTSDDNEKAALNAPLEFAAIVDTACPATVTDIDGNVYHTVKIGKQYWLKENLRTTRYKDGSAIPTGLNSNQWEFATQGAYSKTPQTPEFYYNYLAVKDSRGICPTGWHVPTDEELYELIDALGGTNVAGRKLKTVESGGDNSSGFSANLAGMRNMYASYGFQYIGTQGFWWTSRTNGWNDGIVLNLSKNSDYAVKNYTLRPNSGALIRCIKD